MSKFTLKMIVCGVTGFGFTLGFVLNGFGFAFVVLASIANGIFWSILFDLTE